MLKSYIFSHLARLLRLIVTVALSLMLLLPTVQAAPLTGDYVEDGLHVIQTLRTAIIETDSAAAKEQSEDEASAAIRAFSSRYHGAKYTKRLSFTTLRTVFNTMASKYQSSFKRPFKPDQMERLQSQLNLAEAALKQGR